jgi:hypothetical protein
MWMILLIPTVLSFLLLGAHFLHHGSIPLLVVSLLIPLTMWIRRPWIARAVQVLLLLATLEWVVTAWGLAQDRIAMHEPWTRMAIILGAVALWTACSALLFQTPPLRRHYHHVQPDADGSQKKPT